VAAHKSATHWRTPVISTSTTARASDRYVPAIRKLRASQLRRSRGPPSPRSRGEPIVVPRLLRALALPLCMDSGSEPVHATARASRAKAVVSSRHAGGNRFGLHLGALGRCDQLEEATIRRVLQANGEGSLRPWRDDRVSASARFVEFSAGRSLKITKCIHAVLRSGLARGLTHAPRRDAPSAACLRVIAGSCSTSTCFH
jgi:hypothetical protein